VVTNPGSVSMVPGFRRLLGWDLAVSPLAAQLVADDRAESAVASLARRPEIAGIARSAEHDGQDVVNLGCGVAASPALATVLGEAGFA
jgi:hypothetical protein